MSKTISQLICLAVLVGAAWSAHALDPRQPPGGNFDLSHWYVQLPTAGGVLTGTAGSVDSASTAQLVAGFTNAYFYTGPDGAMTFWAPDDGATTGGSTHPRSELRELIDPSNTSSNWNLYGTHILTATCVVSNVPADTKKVCIGQIHEPGFLSDGVTPGADNEQMIMFDLANQAIYANINLDGNTNSTFSVTFLSGTSVALGKPINYSVSVVDGVLQITVNNVTNAWNLFSGTNYQGHIAQNWTTSSSNTVYFKAGDYNQTDNSCGCSNDGARVAFYALTRYHAPNITNQPASVTVLAGANATFAVAASSTGPLGYQWWFNGTNRLVNATNAALALTNVSDANAGAYTVVVSDSTSSFQSVTSAVAGLTVVDPPTITTQPRSQTVSASTNVTFSAAAGGSPSTVQWRRNGGAISGAVFPTLLLTNVSSVNAGSYTATFTNAAGSATTEPAILQIIGPVTQTFTTPGTNGWICPVGVTTIQVECWGGGGAGGSALRNPNSGSVQYGGGAAGGAYARVNAYSVTAGNTYYLAVGAGAVAANGTLTEGFAVSGGDSWFNAMNAEPVGAGNCVAKGGAGGACAVGDTASTAYGAGGIGTTNGSWGDAVFAGGGGGTETSSANGYGGGGGGSGGPGAAGNSGGNANGAGALAVVGGGAGGNANATPGASGPGQTPPTGPGGGGGGARATTQQPGGNGAAGQVVLTYVIGPTAPPVFTGLNWSADLSAFTLTGTGAVNQTYVLLKATNLTPPVSWSPVRTNSADGGGNFSFTDAPSAYSSQGFYRVTAP